MSKKVSDILPDTEILAQLAEEASELAPHRKDGLKMWSNKSDVTSEAVEAVMGHFIMEMMRDNKTEIQKAWEVRGGKTLKVTFELSTNKEQSDE